MRLLARRRKTMQPGRRYLDAAGEEARRRGDEFVGTEHVLLVIAADPGETLERVGLTPADVREAVAARLAAPIDPDALATLGIDLEQVRRSIEETFGPGALDRTRSECLSVSPRVKQALELAVAEAADEPLEHEHVLRALLSVEESAAADILRALGVSESQLR